MSNEEYIQTKKLEKGNLKSFVGLVKLFAEVFEMENFSIPNIEHLQNLFNRDDFHVFVAIKDDIVLGGLTIYVLEQYYYKRPLAYVYDLAVHPKYQRQGIGKKLIEEAKKSCKMNGFEDMFVQAGSSDEKAVEFYRRTNPSEEEKVVHFSYILNT